jgi:hypothetical protein
MLLNVAFEVRSKKPLSPCAAKIATVGGGTSGARSPRKSAFGKVGASKEEMKDKRAQAKPAKHQRPDRYYEEPLEDKGGHPPTQSERNPIASANEPARNWANLRGAGAEVRVIPFGCAKVQL